MRGVYVYGAALICADCARPVIAECTACSVSEHDERMPQGPYADGGGEADTPQHCDRCGVFLDNPLTDDGRAYVRAALASGRGDPDTLATWRDAYGATLDNLDNPES